MSASGDGNLSVHSARLLSSGLSLVAAELRLQFEQARPRALRMAVGALALGLGVAFAALCIVLAAVSPLLLQWSSVEGLALSIAACAGLSLVGFIAAFWAWRRKRSSEHDAEPGWRARERAFESLEDGVQPEGKQL